MFGLGALITAAFIFIALLIVVTMPGGLEDNSSAVSTEPDTERAHGAHRPWTEWLTQPVASGRPYIFSLSPARISHQFTG